MNKLFKHFVLLAMSFAMVCGMSKKSEAAVLTNVVIDNEGTEIRKVKYTNREEVSKFVGLLSFIYGSFKYDIYYKCRGFWNPEDDYISYEDLWRMLWSRYMFQRGKSEQELERSKFLAHMILSNCIKDELMRVYWPTLKSSISGILSPVMRSTRFTIEARKPVGKMWQDWKITTG